LTGRLAGLAAARGTHAREYIRECARLLDGPYVISSICRALLHGHLSHLAFLVPGEWLYQRTRAQMWSTIHE
jgi:hypothetical protein